MTHGDLTKLGGDGGGCTFLGDPHAKDINISGCMLGSPCLGKLPYVGGGGIVRMEVAFGTL